MKKKIVVTLLICMIAMTTLLAFAGCQKYLNNDTLLGYDVDLAKAVAQELGLEVKFKEIDWDRKIIELKAGYIDFTWNGMTILDSLKDEMEITQPYMYNKQVGVIKKSNADKYNSLESIKNARFAYEVDSSAEKFANSQNYKGTSYKSQMLAMTSVLSGSSDVAIVDLLLANFYSSSESSFSDLMIGVEFSDETYGIGMRKGDLGTLDKLCTTIMKLQENGTVAEIAKKYGLEDQIIEMNYVSQWDSLTDEQKAGWNKIQERGYFVVGCTIFAPIAYEK